ncbi:hypothetical protein [Luteipulveratus mongoliensis]|uniref:Uncharacterized protein n=1 Tax=Luteipulveratus mongoliensis TaxID=571913 RepID=A0A0K1JMK2_9MICO|nr:hypothetical protein [Luteipulveratus mongoliensis]AKU17808.1 hypothetical protein VV02_21355 [Luteipulveratus mongoliensis]
MADPFEVLNKSQKAAVKLAMESLRTMRDTAVTGVTAPDELLRQVTELAGALTGLAGVTAQPLQDFIVRQRELAESISALAEAQEQLAGLAADMAEKHAATVTALEKMTAPFFALAGTEPTPPTRRKPTA